MTGWMNVWRNECIDEWMNVDPKTETKSGSQQDTPPEGLNHDLKSGGHVGQVRFLSWLMEWTSEAALWPWPIATQRLGGGRVLHHTSATTLVNLLSLHTSLPSSQILFLSCLLSFRGPEDALLNPTPRCNLCTLIPRRSARPARAVLTERSATPTFLRRLVF